jgi:PAS domain S-box-containing protein
MNGGGSVGIHKDKSLSADELRQQAEDRLQERASDQHSPLTDEVTQRLVHELEVHQIELEMQNEELVQARDQVDRTLDMYTDLYDFAPVGYFTLDHAGIIKAANLSGASLFGIERARLLNRRLGDFLPINARPFFSDLLGKVLGQHGKESCEMPLAKEGHHPRFVQIEAMADSSGNVCRIAVIDITERRVAEADLAAKKVASCAESELT